MSQLVHAHVLFGQTEVSNSDVAIFVKQDIFRFEVSVDDAVFVQTANRIDDLSSVYLGSLLGESLVFAQISKHFSSV